MRILLIGASADSSILDVERGWLDALRRAGHDVYRYSLNNRLKMVAPWFTVMENGLYCSHCGNEELQPVEGFRSSVVQVASAASDCAVHEAIRFRAELAVVVSGCSFHPDAAAMLQSVGVPVLTVATECPYNDDDMADLASVSSLVACNERASVSTFSAITSALYLPTAYDPERHTPGPAEADKVCDVFLCGTGFDERTRLIAETDWTGVDLRLAGFWPETDGAQFADVRTEAEAARLGQIKIGHDPRVRPYVVAGLIDNDETVRWYRSARIVLAHHRDHPWAQSVGPRVYEAAAVGAFQVCDDSRPELDDVFAGAVPMYRSGDPEHLGWLVRHYLERPEERARLAAEARRRVAAHTYDARVETALRCVAPLRKRWAA